MKVDGNESIVTAFLSAWGHGFAEEERSDFYLVTRNDAIGCKQRRCKKWEIKYRVEYDAATTSERYVKVKYGKKARISAYSNEIICDLAKFNLTSNLDWTLNEKLLRLSKRRTFFNFCPQFGNIVECCHVDVGDAEGYDPPTVEGEFAHPTPHPRARSRWLSVSIEGKDVGCIQQELFAAQYDHLFRLLTSSRSTVLLGGYPAFLNHIEGRKAGEYGAPAVEELASWRETSSE